MLKQANHKEPNMPPADYLPNCEQHYREAAWKAEQDFAEHMIGGQS